jgi:hypothetical protein
MRDHQYRRVHVEVRQPARQAPANLLTTYRQAASRMRPQASMCASW